MVYYTPWIYVIITVVGIVYGSYAGYREAKKENPNLEFDVEMFFISLLRSLPAIIAAAIAAAVPLTFGSNEEIITAIAALITAFFAGVGSDVVLKRTWRAATG